MKWGFLGVTWGGQGSACRYGCRGARYLSQAFISWLGWRVCLLGLLLLSLPSCDVGPLSGGAGLVMPALRAA